MTQEHRRDFLWSLVAGLAVSIPAPLRGQEPQGQSARDLLDHYFRAVQARDLDRVMALFAPDARYEDVTFQFAIDGAAAIRQMFSESFKGLGEPAWQLRRSVVEADRVVAEWAVDGRHSGSILGVEATGRALQLRGMSLLEVRQGRIRSVTDYVDRAGLETQLGLRPR